MPQQEGYFKDKILPPVIVALIIGSVSVYGTYVVYGERISALEKRADRIEAQAANLEHTVNGIANDVSYIRGKLEPKP
jgi:hypothetical protein